ncbi:FAD-dependent oxidoreductase [Pseudoclavibacter sp. CFCC 13611]|uniref:FAD-dependent oxidoreductase n=1 Tax=Pseudoclavibacter sp. CFCC 13611 TaxID=2615178 RepID=UPI0013017458|nr:FAD-dependent oxidoreductase [Pseudoclavibacter sp. CFCC 13611]KAB1663696.1 FAD-dependent oxidoreductase [Pseudoclavibacter sp. CFCC 13611]KAB1664555.1 FAD-dependent oxidoreductase [Pseudoclavibacter sp. CFCC 13611]
MNKHVIVIGAGVVGLATAWRLHQRGHAVTIVDPAPASGASHAAAGMLAAVSEYAFEEESLLALSVPAARLYPQIVAELDQATVVGTGYRSTPTIVATADAADRELLRSLRAQQLELGLDVQDLTSREARALEPLLGPGISGAFLARDDHQITPRRLAGAYISALEVCDDVHVVPERAVELLWRDERVIGVRLEPSERREGPVTHRFDEQPAWPSSEVVADVPPASPTPSVSAQQVIEADEVVVANGLESPRLGGLPRGLVWPIRPVHGDVLRLRTPEQLRPLTTHTIRGLVHGRSVYIVPREDGTVVIGATEREDARDAVLAGSVLQLLRDAHELLPAVDDLELIEATARARPGTPDNAPLLGRVADGLLANTGTHRHGILLSAQNAVVISDLVDGTAAASDWQAFDPWRFSSDDRSETPTGASA